MTESKNRGIREKVDRIEQFVYEHSTEMGRKTVGNFLVMITLFEDPDVPLVAKGATLGALWVAARKLNRIEGFVDNKKPAGKLDNYLMMGIAVIGDYELYKLLAGKEAVARAETEVAAKVARWEQENRSKK